jgi:hypothetical protein
VAERKKRRRRERRRGERLKDNKKLTQDSKEERFKGRKNERLKP